MSLKRISKEWLIIVGFALTKLIIHLLVSSNYELQRDAYLYLALGDHLSWGYVSVPPSIAAFRNISQLLFGDSVTAIRVFPALLGSASVIFVGLIVRELKGGNTALFIACLAFLLSPAYLNKLSFSTCCIQPVLLGSFFLSNHQVD